MEYDFYKGDWVLCCANPNPSEFVKITALHTGLSVNANTRNFPGDKLHDTSINVNDIEPIPIKPSVLEAFGFKEGVLNDTAQPCWIMWWVETDTQTSVEVWPEKFQDTDGTDWMCRINRQLNHCQVQVNNIHEIQHAMRVARITKELNFNPTTQP